MDQDDIHGRLAIRVLGPFSIMLGGVAQPSTSKKAVAILAYLVRRPDIRVPRETIAGLLWADAARGLRLICLVLAAFIGIGVTFGFHWLSEFLSGAMIGASIGHWIGGSTAAHRSSVERQTDGA